MTSQDGKKRQTDVADTEQLLRLIQSIPSKKAEPFKLWLAQVGRERIEETIDPEMSIDRAMETYARLGYPEDWINQRLQTIRARKELTDQWKAHGVEEGKRALGTGDCASSLEQVLLWSWPLPNLILSTTLFYE